MPEITSTMPDHTEAATNLERELTLTRIIDATPDKLFRAWTEPDLIVQWFTPPPYKTIAAEVDLRAGGSSLVVMQAPDGTEIPNRGIYLEVVMNERLVFTDAYTSAWEPSEKPFMTGILTFEEHEGKTKYTARVLHWTVADREAHEKMGFHEGWGIATDQLEALVAKLK
ncbi:MAG: SRPBCC family protein [Candidatus Obscuribacterales bacterium]